MNFVNLTPHTLNVHSNGTITDVPPSGNVARVEVSITQEDTINGINIYGTTFGDVVGLPPYRPAENLIFIVSGKVKAAVPSRHDVMCPGSLLRDENGKPIGCEGLHR